MADSTQASAWSQAYPFPNQENAETQRLNTQHEVFRARLKALYKTPLPPSATRVLDLGCGTGIWTKEFAFQHSNIETLGIDLSPPAERGVAPSTFPSNCKFAKADFSSDWSFAASAINPSDKLFDLVYARMLLAGVRDWPGLFENIYAHIRPGGNLELFEGLFELRSSDNSITEADSPAMRWFGFAQRHLAINGMKWNRAMDLPELMQQAGFEIVHDQPLKMKLCSDEEDPAESRVWIAEQYSKDMIGVVRNMTERMFGSGSAGISAEDGRRLADEAVEDLRLNNEKRGYYATLYVRVGRKPVVI